MEDYGVELKKYGMKKEQYLSMMQAGSIAAHNGSPYAFYIPKVVGSQPMLFKAKEHFPQCRKEQNANSDNFQAFNEFSKLLKDTPALTKIVESNNGRSMVILDAINKNCYYIFVANNRILFKMFFKASDKIYLYFVSNSDVCRRVANGQIVIGVENISEMVVKNGSPILMTGDDDIPSSI